jgi:hypothetical protein
LSRAVVVSVILAGVLAAAVAAGQEDVSQVPREERLLRIETLLYIMESEGGWARETEKHNVGPLLDLRADFSRDDSWRAARALRRITGLDYGEDFEAWAAWFETVRDEEEWRPDEFGAREEGGGGSWDLERIMPKLLGLLMMGAGAFSICGAWYNWEWFMTARKARFFVAILGRTGARGFYFLLGGCLVVLGILMLFGVIAG